MMKQLARRTFLRGLGTAVALPFLDAMSPAFAKTAVGPKRVVWVYAPTGMEMNWWTPKAEGRNFDFPRIMKSMEPYQDDLLVLSGLAHKNGLSLGDGPGDHARAIACYLTGVHPRKTEGADIRSGVSVDQILAEHIGADTRFPSLQVACEDSRQVGACDSYSCVYQNISWHSETQALVPDINPRSIFERLFGGSGDSDSGVSPANAKVYQNSILDFVSDQTQSLKTSLGPADRRKLDEYLYGIREIEQRIAKAEKESVEAPPELKVPYGIPLIFAEHARLIFDLLTVALRTDMTRVATFMLAREGGLKPYPEIGVPEAHHSITHHRNQPDLVEKCIKINTHFTEQFAYFVDKIKKTPDGDGSLLDHSLLVFGSGLGEPNGHQHYNFPLMLAGNMYGAVKTGRHITQPQQTPCSNLWLSVLGLAGVPTEKFGDSDGRLDYLTDL